MFNLTRGDTGIVHWMNVKSKKQPRDPATSALQITTLSQLHKARLHLRNVFLQDLGPGKIYINENLTGW